MVGATGGRPAGRDRGSRGPAQGTRTQPRAGPYADRLEHSTLANLKELRVQHRGGPYRVLFAFDPKREALLLLAGNKGGDKRWYQKNIPRAEAIFARHRAELEAGNG